MIVMRTQTGLSATKRSLDFLQLTSDRDYSKELVWAHNSICHYPQTSQRITDGRLCGLHFSTTLSPSRRRQSVHEAMGKQNLVLGSRATLRGPHVMLCLQILGPHET
jgi:hypothetical protein